jgi:biotin synthase-related radical SAM superfamily protein
MKALGTHFLQHTAVVSLLQETVYDSDLEEERDHGQEYVAVQLDVADESLAAEASTRVAGLGKTRTRE